MSVRDHWTDGERLWLWAQNGGLYNKYINRTIKSHRHQNIIKYIYISGFHFCWVTGSLMKNKENVRIQSLVSARRWTVSGSPCLSHDMWKQRFKPLFLQPWHNYLLMAKGVNELLSRANLKTANFCSKVEQIQGYKNVDLTTTRCAGLYIHDLHTTIIGDVRLLHQLHG